MTDDLLPVKTDKHKWFLFVNHYIWIAVRNAPWITPYTFAVADLKCHIIPLTFFKIASFKQLKRSPKKCKIFKWCCRYLNTLSIFHFLSLSNRIGPYLVEGNSPTSAIHVRWKAANSQVKLLNKKCWTWEKPRKEKHNIAYKRRLWKHPMWHPHHERRQHTSGIKSYI